MQIEAIYENGRLEFPRPIHFKQGPVRLLIEVSPEAIEDAASDAKSAVEFDAAAIAAGLGEQIPQPPSAPKALAAHALPSDVLARLEHRRAVRTEILTRSPIAEPDPQQTEEQRLRELAFAERQVWRADQGRT